MTTPTKFTKLANKSNYIIRQSTRLKINRHFTTSKIEKKISGFVGHPKIYIYRL